MKQGIIITLGGILIIAVFGVWIYLLIFGTPENSEQLFADLGFGEEEIPRAPAPLETVSEPETTVQIGDSALAQITTRPAAGFEFAHTASSTAIRYAERGVGHVYEIDLTTGVEKRVLGKTFTAITEAVFSPSGTAVALVSMSGDERTAYLEEIGTEDESVVAHEFPADAENIAFPNDAEVRYTRTDTNGMTGYSYDLASETTTELFTIPFTDATVLWTENETLVYNRPAPYLQGGLYAIEGNALRRIGATAYGFSALARPTEGTYVRTYANVETDTLISVLTGSTGTELLMPITAIPEKCAFDLFDETTVWCAAPAADLNRTYQADWYKGLTTSRDVLWEIDTEAQEATVAVDFASAAGRTIDVSDLIMDETGIYLLFANKLDGSLWLYEPDFETEFEPDTGSEA